MWRMLLTTELLKAARGIVRWSVNELAEESGVSPDTLRSFESGRTKSLSAHNQDAVQKALEGVGVQFMEKGDMSEGIGVAIKKE